MTAPLPFARDAVWAARRAALLDAADEIRRLRSPNPWEGSATDLARDEGLRAAVDAVKRMAGGGPIDAPAPSNLPPQLSRRAPCAWRRPPHRPEVERINGPALAAFGVALVTGLAIVGAIWWGVAL